MSAETLEWLNTQTLIGNTETYGLPWHYSADLQPERPTVYAGFIPKEDVIERLFNFTVVVKPLYIPFERSIGGETVQSYIEVPNRFAVTREDTNEVFYICTEKYEVHQYPEWLLDHVGRILERSDGELGLTSALLLDGGGVASVTLELPMPVDNGIDVLRPFLSVFTSHNARYKTTYMTGTERPICDNTLMSARQDAKAMKKFMHLTSTSQPTDKTDDVLDALSIMRDAAAAEAHRLDVLANTPVTDRQWEQIIEKMWEKPAENAKQKAITTWNNRATEVSDLFYNDPRVAPWKNTGWGAYQAINTWFTHMRPLRTRGGVAPDRADRNVKRFLDGEVAKTDSAALGHISRVTGAELAEV